MFEKHKLPAFGAVELAVDRGGVVFGLVSSYKSVGELAAKKSIAILSGRATAAQIPAEQLKRFSLIVNMDIARKLQIYPPVALLNYAVTRDGGAGD